MPYKTVYFPAPTNLELPVLKKQPDGREFNFGVKSVIVMDGDNKGKHYYECADYCKGWIEGEPSHFREDTMGPLCGRRGYSDHCIRCGHEIHFSGAVS